MATADMYRGMTQLELDRALSPSLTVDRLEHYLWLYAEQSRLARASLDDVAHLDLAYGPDERHRLDAFACGKPGAPLLVYLHGGFWQALAKDDASFAGPACRAAGVHFAAIGYRLGQTTRLAGIVNDVRLGLEELGERAPSIGFDPSRVVLIGHSAGAHLAAMVAATGGVESLDLAGVSLVGGVFDLEPVRHSYVNEVMQLTADDVGPLSPVRFDAPVGCQVLITYAEHDTAEFVRQSVALAERWSVAPEPPQLGLNHFNSPMDLADPASRLFRRTVALAG